ncbi:MAG: hypothetical protein H7833_06260 [Magnetococcus sp. DMHC-1]
MRLSRGHTEYRLVARDESGIDPRQSVKFRDQREIRTFLAELLRNDAAFAQLRWAVSRCGHHTRILQTDRQDVLHLAAVMIFRGDCLRVVAIEHVPTARVVWTPGESAIALVKPIVPPKQAANKPPRRFASLRPRLPTTKNDPEWNPLRRAIMEARKKHKVGCELCAKSSAKKM